MKSSFINVFMSFLTFINYIKNKYSINHEIIIFWLLYKTSKKIKNTLTFIKYRNQKIDFEIKGYEKLLNEYLLNKKPIELLTNDVRFYNLDFKIFKGVLIPRPDTEILCEKVINILNNDKNLIDGVDLCCGSGSIGITLKKHIKKIKLDAIDIQKISCENTTYNAHKHHVDIKVMYGDFYQTIINRKKQYDFIICNPPYVAINQLDKNMLAYENKINFTNSKDPLFFYKKIIRNFKKIVRNPNHFLLAFEIGYDQKNKLTKFIKTTSLLKYTSFYKDYNNNDRVMLIYKKQS